MVIVGDIVYPVTYRASSSTSNPPSQPGSDDAPEARFNPDAATALICPESKTSENYQDPGCPEGEYIKKYIELNMSLQHC